MAFADWTLLARLNKYAEEHNYRRSYGNGTPHPSHISEHMSDAELIAEIVKLAELYAAEMRSNLPLAMAREKIGKR